MIRQLLCTHSTKRSVTDDWGTATTCDHCGKAWVRWTRSSASLVAEYKRQMVARASGGTNG